MKRPIAILLGLALLANADVVFARSGGGRGGHAGVSGHVGVVSAHVGHPGGRPFVSVRPGPVFIGRPPFFRHRVVVGGAIVVGAPFFYSYPYPYYYPPAAPVYSQPPTYIEQGGGPYYYCPDYRDYYPNVSTCPSPWLQVLPGGSGYPN